MCELVRDRIAVVTGASSGNGRAIARLLGQHGATVVCADLRPQAQNEGYETDRQQSTVEAIQDDGGEAIYLRADVARKADMQALIKETVDRFGRLDIMVNNAGVYNGLTPIHEEREEDYDRVMTINAKGTWLGCREAIRQMTTQEQGGRIINISSIGGIAGLAAEPAYSASKGAVTNLTRQLALDYAPYYINVNAICPGYIHTAMCRGMFDVPEVQEAIETATPWPRLGRPEDVARAALFLASDLAEWITGTILVVDGGWSAGEHFFPPVDITAGT